MFSRVISKTAPAMILGAVAVQTSAKKEEVKTDALPSPYMRKPSELPIYTPIHELEKKPNQECHERKPNVVEENLQGAFRAVRVETSKVLDVVSSNKDQINSSIDKLKNETKGIHEYLNKEENSIPRAGAMVLGGMAGIIFGVRGGIIRKLVYGTIGTGAMGSICYPKEAEKIAQQSLVEAKKAATVAINFAYGIKPGDDTPPINFPTIPTSLSEVGSSLSGAVGSIKDKIFSK